MKKVVSKRFIYRVLGAGTIAFIAGTSFASTVSPQADNPSKPSALSLKIDESPLQRDQSLKSSYAPIVQRVAPSVVKVFVTSSAPETQLSLPHLDFFRHFFGEGQLNLGHPPYQPEHALGSGVIVSADGYILTNNRVVKNAREIQVALNDGRTFTAKIVGTDSQTDVALLKVRADNLPELTLADSDKSNIGDVVLAIGNPFGIGQTVTAGIVSAKHRVTAGDTDEDFIQTDAAINPGNSGGALVDTEGRLIGINAEILSRSGGNQGIGFAVPSNLCRWVMESLVRKGQVDRGFLGIDIQNLTPGLAQAFKAGTTNGALVSGVTPGSPADAAGLKSADVIIEFDGRPVADANQLKLRVAETDPGTTVMVKAKHNGEPNTFNVTLKQSTENETANANAPKSNSNDQDALHGVVVADLDQQARAQLNIPVNVRGALVTEVDPNSAAYEAGLRTGNVILQIGNKPVTDAQDAVIDTAKRNGNMTLVRVWSLEGIHYLTVKEPKVG
ncbi:MAG: Do family serine endopeptidase [Chthoniobacterales bacterium]